MSQAFESKLFGSARNLVRKNHIDLVYIRHMVPTFQLISFLFFCRCQNIKIYYELPTYPYFGEQLKASRNKIKTTARIIYEIACWLLIYSLINYLVTIKSNSNARDFKKMRRITNGLDPSEIKIKEICDKDAVISLVGVGTIYPYHGYDRILRGLKEVEERVGSFTIELNIVGESETIDRLKDLSRQLGLKHVFFHGKKNTVQLNEMYDRFDIGLGCLALHRRNANIDTTIKIIEYYCRGVIVVTSGQSPFDDYNKNYTIHINDSDKPADIRYIVSEYIKIQDKYKEIALTSRKCFSWDTIMSQLITEESNKNE